MTAARAGARSPSLSLMYWSTSTCGDGILAAAEKLRPPPRVRGAGRAGGDEQMRPDGTPACLPRRGAAKVCENIEFPYIKKRSRIHAKNQFLPYKVLSKASKFGGHGAI